jgi:hypothetical protein
MPTRPSGAWKDERVVLALAPSPSARGDEALARLGMTRGEKRK